MNAQDLLSDEDFDFAMSRSLSERPDRHQCFVVNDFKTPGTMNRERRENIIIRDQREEDRRKGKRRT
jgi:hypothetical protein